MARLLLAWEESFASDEESPIAWTGQIGTIFPAFLDFQKHPIAPPKESLRDEFLQKLTLWGEISRDLAISVKNPLLGGAETPRSGGRM
jgi:hypothetical protein